MSMFFASSGSPTYKYNGVLAGIPATCAVGDLAFVTNATAGQNIYECTAANTWTQQAGGGGGGSVAVEGTTVTNPSFSSNAFNRYAGARFGSFGSTITAQAAFPQNTNLYVFGDSTAMVGSSSNGDSAPATGFNGQSGYVGQLFNNAFTGVGQDWAAGGDQWEDTVVRLFTHLSDWWLAANSSGQQQSATVLLTPGINNANFKGTNTYLTTISRPTIYAGMTAAMLHSANITFGQAAGCVKTGTWTTDNTTFVTGITPTDTITGIAEVSNTNGDTIACPITTTSDSPVGIVWYGMKDSNAGTFTLSSAAGACTDVVTGGTTINAFGGAAIATNNGAAVTIGAALCPLVAGAYTMTATITSATNAANKVWILGMGALPAFPGHRATVSPLLVGGVLRARTDTNSTWTNNYDQENMNAAARLSTAYNFPVQFVPLHTYTVATLPAAPITGAVADVNDSASATACTSGGGSNVVRCRYNGSSWDAQIGGVPPIALPTASGFYTDGLHPARALHALIYEQFAPFVPNRVSNSTTALGFAVAGATTASTGSTVPLWWFTAATGALALGDGSAFGANNGSLDLRLGTIHHGIDNLYSDASTIDQQRGITFSLMSSGSRFGFTSGSGVSSEDTTISRDSAGVLKANTTSSGNGLGKWKGAGYLTTANCSSSAAPAVCAAASAGSVVVAAAATTVVVNTTAVTANSQIFLTFDSSLGAKLSVTCNTTEPALYGVSARSAGTSFTITSSSPVTNPACFSYFIVN